MGKVVGIISIKGGVGKTTAVAALGAALAKEFNKKVLVIDANFTAPNLGLHLGYVNPENTIHDVLQDKIKVEEAVYSSEHGFHIIAGSLLNKEVNPLKLKDKIQKLKDAYDIILLDSSPTLNNEILSVMMASDELFCVTTPDYPTLSCTLRAIKHAKERGTQINGLILNKIRKKDFELSLEEIEDTSNCNVVAVLPDEHHILRALSETTPSTIFNNNVDSTIEYKKFAAALIKENYYDNRFKARLKRIFNKELPKQDINRDILKKSLK